MIHRRRLFSTGRFLFPVLLFLLVSPLRGCGPKVPLGFRTELIYAAPDIEHPSVVTCDDEGNLFVGEDAMDMRGPAAEPIDRVLLIRWDKSGGPPTKTVFCQGLSAVFGLVWHGGALYVMHAPHYSRFIDTDGDGIADVRKDLAHGFGPPAGTYEFNDHIVSGMQLGMDGLMYVSVGDKGIPQATGADGSTISLEGGGIVRMRPDGTELELFSSGTRNHLDVAMDAFDNLFTYDNTDDGYGWWTRFTHQIPTGYYGYPYDYRTHSDRHLPPICEHGAGAPAGGACYLEAGWPEKYRGSVLFCEWGKRRIQRFTLRPRGASFDAVIENFMERAHNDEFRPLDLCFSPDGRHMYVADWNYAGWVKPTVAGRLYRVTYIGRDVATEPPRAAPDAPIDALIRSLGHPARSERMRAQWRLAACAEAAIPAVALVLRSDPSALARVHAIWTQNALVDRVAGYDPSADWIGALSDKTAVVRAQAARALGTRRIATASAALTCSLRDSDAAVRLQAVVALGRLNDSAQVQGLVDALTDEDNSVRFAVMQALRAIGCWEPLAAALQSTNPKMRRAVVQTATGVYDRGAVEMLAQAARALPDIEERAAALVAISEVHRQSAPYQGGWWGGRPAGGEPLRPRQNEWPGTSLVLGTLREALGPPNPQAVRWVAVRAFRDVPDPLALSPLRVLAASDADVALRRATLMTLRILEDRGSAPLFACIAGDARNDDGLRQEAVRAIIALGLTESAPQMLEIVEADDSSEGLLSLALEALKGMVSAESKSSIERRLTDPLPTIRVRAVEAWAALRGAEGASRLADLMRAERDVKVREAILGALGRLRVIASVPAIIDAANEPALKFEAQRALGAMPDRRALLLYLDGLVSPNAELRKVSHSALMAIRAQIGDDIVDLHRRGQLPPNVRQALQSVLGDAKGEHNPRFASLFDNLPPVPDPAAYANFVNRTNGNINRGRVLFADPHGVGCVQCHSVHGEGGRIGPDLAGVGALNRRGELARAILEPSDRIAPNYELTSIITTGGKVFSGMVKRETKDALELQHADGTLTRIPHADIEERAKSRVSLMPAGLQEGLTLQDFADLVAYLESLTDTASAGVSDASLLGRQPPR